MKKSIIFLILFNMFLLFGFNVDAWYEEEYDEYTIFGLNPIDNIYTNNGNTILDIKELPYYDADPYDFNDPKSFDHYISDLERIVPYSIEINDQTVSEQVFLLSRDEVEKYIPKKEDRIAYAVIDFDILVSNVKKPWLLRFNESERYYFVVDKEGEIIVASWYYDGYRPAVWVK